MGSRRLCQYQLQRSHHLPRQHTLYDALAPQCHIFPPRQPAMEEGWEIVFLPTFWCGVGGLEKKWCLLGKKRTIFLSDFDQ